MFDVKEFFEESKKTIQQDNVVSAANFAQVAISKKFIDVLTFIICSPYFVGKKHATTGILNFEDHDLTTGDEYSTNCRGSIMGDSQQFYWTFASMKGKIAQDATSQNRDITAAILKQYKELSKEHEALIDKNPTLDEDSIPLKPLVFEGPATYKTFNYYTHSESTAFKKSVAALLKNYEAYMKDQILISVFDNAGFDALAADDPLRDSLTTNIRTVFDQLKKFDTTQEPIEKFFDCKIINFYGENANQAYGGLQSPPDYKSGHVAACVHTFCDVPFRIGFYRMGGDKFAFSEALQKEKQLVARVGDVVPKSVVTYNLKRHYDVVQPLRNDWNTRTHDNKKIAEIASRIVVNAKINENTVLQKFERESIVKGITAPIHSAMMKNATLLQAHCTPANLVVFPKTLKGDYHKYVLNIGSSIATLPLKMAKDAIKAAVVPYDSKYVLQTEDEKKIADGRGNAAALGQALGLTIPARRQ